MAEGAVATAVGHGTVPVRLSAETHPVRCCRHGARNNAI